MNQGPVQDTSSPQQLFEKHSILPAISAPSSWVEISRSAIEHNIATYKNIIGPDVYLAPVIKANAYGHGILQVAPILEQHQAVSYICVVNLSEALVLRAHGIRKPILVLSYIDAPLEQAIIHDIDIPIFDYLTAHHANELAQSLGKKCTLHIKVDTGLSRAGKRYSEAIAFIQQIAGLSHCIIKGIFSHLANSEHKDQKYVFHQLENFNRVIQAAEEQGIHIPLKHTSCSAALLSAPTTHYNFARLGIGTYGLWPSSDNKTLAHINFPQVTLKPAMSWKTRIVQIKTVPEGSTVGYDRTHITTRQTILALLPIGYYEGYDRKLSNRATVLINNRFARVVGRISMNLTMVDITDIPGVEVGMEVILLGDKGPISAEALAEIIGTINYEVVTRINPLLERKVTT